MESPDKKRKLTNPFNRMTRIYNASDVPMIWEARTNENTNRWPLVEIDPQKYMDKCYREYDFGDADPDIHVKIHVYPKGSHQHNVRKVIMPRDLLNCSHIDLKLNNGVVVVDKHDAGTLQRLRVTMMAKDSCKKAMEKIKEKAEVVKSAIKKKEKGYVNLGSESSSSSLF
ncbi:hypothetical protein RJ641_024232 [Dillenia turbinata]|uniref:Uncharacterized protein n=1 Tax=Dillenia turbinata TaxID=194707 RepID=A0AAN8UG39_9MAGN